MNSVQALFKERVTPPHQILEDCVNLNDKDSKYEYLFMKLVRFLHLE